MFVGGTPTSCPAFLMLLFFVSVVFCALRSHRTGERTFLFVSLVLAWVPQGAAPGQNASVRGLLEVTPGNLGGYGEVRWEGKEISKRCVKEKVGFSPTRWCVTSSSHPSLAGGTLGPLTPSSPVCPAVLPTEWETAPSCR